MSGVWRSWWTGRGIRTRSCWPTPATASLADLAKPLAVDETIGLAVALARAVAGMHRRGVMHRDISPANVVVSSDVAPTLIDFALATSVA